MGIVATSVAARSMVKSCYPALDNTFLLDQHEMLLLSLKADLKKVFELKSVDYGKLSMIKAYSSNYKFKLPFFKKITF